MTWGPRTRRPRHDPDYEAYTTIQPAFSRQSEGVNMDYGIMQAYALGLADTDSERSSPSGRGLHRSQLPPEPKDWKEMRRHPYKVEFTKAAHTEKDGLMSRGTYSICDYPDEKWLNKKGKRVIPLKWVFFYKFDEDGYLVKFKA